MQSDENQPQHLNQHQYRSAVQETQMHLQLETGTVRQKGAWDGPWQAVPQQARRCLQALADVPLNSQHDAVALAAQHFAKDIQGHRSSAVLQQQQEQVPQQQAQIQQAAAAEPAAAAMLQRHAQAPRLSVAQGTALRRPPLAPHASGSTQRVHFVVPFEQRHAAKELGARFDGERKLWYADGVRERQALDAHFARCNMVPVQLVGEDRAFAGNRLFIDLIPSTSWYQNARSMIHPSDWDRVRLHVYARASYRCECCGVDTKDANAGPGGRGTQIEAHERWHYDEATGAQTLRRLVALCRECHAATHMGLAQVQGRGDAAMAHFQRVAGLTAAQAHEQALQAFELWAVRSTQQWRPDISILTRGGIQTVRRAPSDTGAGGVVDLSN